MPLKHATRLIIALLLSMPSQCQANSLKASWYSLDSLKKEGTYTFSGGIMANGHKFKDNGLTCATGLYPLGSYLMVTNKANNKSVLVKVTDKIGARFKYTRIDLSKGAFARISLLKAGLINVDVKQIKIGVK